MRKAVILLCVLIFISLLNSTTIEVNIDGTGDYLTIQEGINASTDGDTVLVYPGRYFENTDFIGKTITVASLELTTGNTDYIHSTVIDGNQSGCCVAVYNYEEEGTTLRGFIITNGIGFLNGSRRYGGGIYTFNSSLRIINCIVENNSSVGGGGIVIIGSNIFLEGNTIRNNQASEFGGGIASGCLTGSIVYSYENRCNVYDNFSPLGLDIYNSLEIGVITDVIVDTLTVSDPFGYEFYQGDNDYYQNYEDMVFEMLHAKYESVEADLYVSPGGDDNNGGLTVDDPLQTINNALQRIIVDEDNPRTIFLTDGIYSSSLNNQRFPISMRGYVSLIGESEENTIIDLGAGHQGFVIDLFSELGYEFRNFTVRNGFVDEDDSFYHKIFYLLNINYSSELVVMENLQIINNEFDKLISAGDINITLT